MRLIALVLASCCVVAAQPTFRSGVELVTIDVVATDLGGWTAEPVPPTETGPPPPDATTPPNIDTAPDAGTDAESGDDPDRDIRPVVLTGGGSTLDGAQAVVDGTQTVTVYEDPQELARVVASMVREVVEGSEPTVTQGATTDNGAREVPTRLLEPQLVTRVEALALVD